MAQRDYGPDPGEPTRFVGSPGLLGALGIVFSLCCPVLGATLGVLSLMQATRHGGNHLWGALAITTSVLGVFGGTLYLASR